MRKQKVRIYRRSLIRRVISFAAAGTFAMSSFSTVIPAEDITYVQSPYDADEQVQNEDGSSAGAGASGVVTDQMQSDPSLYDGALIADEEETESDEGVQAGEAAVSAGNPSNWPVVVVPASPEADELFIDDAEETAEAVSVEAAPEEEAAADAVSSEETAQAEAEAEEEEEEESGQTLSTGTVAETVLADEASAEAASAEMASAVVEPEVVTGLAGDVTDAAAAIGEEAAGEELTAEAEDSEEAAAEELTAEAEDSEEAAGEELTAEAADSEETGAENTAAAQTVEDADVQIESDPEADPNGAADADSQVIAESETTGDEDSAQTEETAGDEDQTETSSDILLNDDQTLTAAGEDYEITLTYTEDARIPAGSTVTAKEITKASATKTYLKTAEKTLDLNTEDSQKITGRFFDITILDSDGNEIEPAAPVHVTVTCQSDYAQALRSDPQVVHFEDGSKKKAEEVAVQDTTSEEAADTLTFTADSFSVYGVVYTVDFKLGEFAYSIAGESSIKLSQLMAQLGIADFDVTKVARVEFTDSSLVQVTKDEDGSDWTLTSLAPFQSEEKLTVTMSDGSFYEVDVTDEVKDPGNLASYSMHVTASSNQVKDGDMVSFSISYTIPQGANIPDKTLTYQLDPALVIKKEESGRIKQTKVINGVSTEVEVGTYTIGKDGKITLKFDDSFDTTKAFYGSLMFEAEASNKSDSEDIRVKFEDNTEITIKPKTYASDEDLTVVKTATYDETNGYIDYMVKISSTKGTKSEINVADTITGNGIDINTDDIPYISIVDGNGKKVDVDIDNADKESWENYDLKKVFKLPALAAGGSYTIRYHVITKGKEPASTDGSASVNNNAWASTGNGTTDQKTTDTPISSAVVAKTGYADANNGKIVWTVTIHKKGTEDYTLNLNYS